MPNVKIQYITIEDIFFEIGNQLLSRNYPEVEYGDLINYFFYKRKSPATKTKVLATITETDHLGYINNLLKLFVERMLCDYSCFKVELRYEEKPYDSTDISNLIIDYDAYNPASDTTKDLVLKEFNDFVMRFSSFIAESLETWCKKLDIYNEFDFSDFLNNPDKTITKQDIDTPRVAKTRISERLLNDTPEETGDFTGTGYANQYEKITNTENAATGTNQFNSTVTELDYKNILKNLNESLNAVRNIYRQWLLDFRTKVLID